MHVGRLSLEDGPVVPGAIEDPNLLFFPEFTAEGAQRTGDHSDPRPGGEPHHPGSLDVTSWTPTADEAFASAIQSEIDTEVVIQMLMEYICQQEERHANNNSTNPTNLTLAFSPPGASPIPQPSLEASSAHSNMDPTIQPEHQLYRCSWPRQGSYGECGHVAPNRLAFLHHLGAIHQASGAANETIVCQLLDPKTGSTCNAQIKRGNLPRHVDTHYPLRYHCQYCPAGKSFSRPDSLKKHIETKHAASPS